MDINTLRATESKQSSEVARGQAESGDVKTSAEELAALLSRVSEAPTREIEKLINQLQGLRTQLQNAGNRIQRDIAQRTELSQQTMQLTAIISDNVKKLPSGSMKSGYANNTVSRGTSIRTRTNPGNVARPRNGLRHPEPKIDRRLECSARGVKDCRIGSTRGAGRANSKRNDAQRVQALLIR
jgi:hypothetical protein